MDLVHFASSLPYPIKQPLRYIYGAIPFSIRYGKVFRETYAFLQESQWWSREKIEEYQMQQLSKLLNHAYENVPYYRQAFDERGLKPKDIQSPDDLKRLPYLTKDALRQHAESLLTKDARPGRLLLNHTSGTTGKPLHFYEDDSIPLKEWAFICHQWSRVGYRPGEPRVELRGAVNRRRPVEYNPASKILRLSPRIDSKEVALHYLESMRAFGAGFLHGYSGAIAPFAHAIRRHGLRVPFKLRAVLFASESVYEWQRGITEGVFDCRVFSHYGLAEKTVLAAECEHSHHYHCLPQYGITEVDVGSHEIIATGFLNHITPFIRYRTTDVASVPITARCEHCGREYFPVFEKVEGRLEDYIVTPDGTLISPAIITHPFKHLKTIRDTQLVQKTEVELILRVVPWEDSTPEALRSELKQLSHNLQKILAPEMRIETEMVEQIERSESGKFKWIDSEVSRNQLQRGLG